MTHHTNGPAPALDPVADGRPADRPARQLPPADGVDPDELRRVSAAVARSRPPSVRDGDFLTAVFTVAAKAAGEYLDRHEPDCACDGRLQLCCEVRANAERALHLARSASILLSVDCPGLDVDGDTSVSSDLAYLSGVAAEIEAEDEDGSPLEGDGLVGEVSSGVKPVSPEPAVVVTS